MATVTGKRKREDARSKPSAFKKAATAKPAVNGKKQSASSQPARPNDVNSGEAPTAASREHTTSGEIENGTLGDALIIQIVTGSYERVLHGISATIPASLLEKEHPTSTNGPDKDQSADSVESDKVSFSDIFLFTAHASAVRCLAVSPPTENDKRFLASGSSDERINVYSISTTPPGTTRSSKLAEATLSGTPIAENASNKTLGSLIHHDRAVTKLHFPAKGKLFSGAEDNTIAISRTRDWTVLSSIKAPIPKAQGRPSGDTAGPGDVPAGINDFAIHPSQKLMLSVGRGERSMRLWNLMTGKKAGVLNFERDLLAQVGEGKYSSGEGRRVLFNNNGTRYVVAFEKGAAVFDLDSTPDSVIKPSPPTRLHQMHFVPQLSDFLPSGLLAISTEDGRIILHNLASQELMAKEKPKDIAACSFVAQLGGKTVGVSGRIKDFQIIRLPQTDGSAALIIVTASSDGAIRLWTVYADELESAYETGPHVYDGKMENNVLKKKVKQIGTLVGTLETGNRITCMEAFLADGKHMDVKDGHGGDVGLGAEDEDGTGTDGE